MNTGNTSKRMRPWSGASRRFSWISRRVEDTISILRGLRERYELHHGVRIKDTALVAAAVLSNRYITDRFLPDKAIDLVDEAAAKLRTEIDSMPSELDEILRRTMQLEIEREALKKETDAVSKERLTRIEKELAELKTAILGAAGAMADRERRRAAGASAARADRPGEGRNRPGRARLRPEQSRRAEVRAD